MYSYDIFTLVRIALTVQYNGAGYCGFQIQVKEPSVQEELEKAIFTVTRNRSRIHAAGRTDTGVHAFGHVKKLAYSLNCVLPHDISVIHSSVVDGDFHARFSCLERQYVYRVLNTPLRMALYENQRYWIRHELNLEKMREAAEYLIGENDFATFTLLKYVKNGEVTIRRIDEIKLVQQGYMLDIFYRGSGFLHNMIRIISGTLLSVGVSEMEPVAVREMLSARSRVAAGATLPAYALYFVNAIYENYKTPLSLIPFYHEAGLYGVRR